MNLVAVPSPPTELLTLPDGRSLAYIEYGDPRGHPTLYFHGLPGSRLEAALAATRAAEVGVRLIAIDRPGIGGSDPKPRRALLDWPGDVLHLAYHLGLARFTVAGISGGGPYALACAHSIPQHLDAVGIVSGVAPFDRDHLFERMPWLNKVAVRAAQLAPSLVRHGLKSAVILKLCPHFAIGLLARTLDTPDHEVLNRTEVKDAIARSLVESLRQGAQGMADDLLILARPWGFRLRDVSINVNVWHGGRDSIVPASHGRDLRRRLGHSRFAFFPEEGHLSLVINHATSIFANLSNARLGTPSTF